ncbi:unnamed protein product [Dimorphilus gyrociliatus]|uniref:J domain-containing protein n=1 Tax=Dimorphilus gyrociliatus TaxID=2664684 RepID=A0A7I8WDI9_9ANNE|nr:unnamed protein product [Dimorphilus gyrociliatus]
MMLLLQQRNIPFVQLRRIASTVKEVNFYDILQISPKASQSQVKKAFYKLSKTYHPDVNKSKEAKEKYIKITEAYEILGNSDQRKMYDERFEIYEVKEAMKNVDPSYRQFYRQRGTFKARSKAPMSGRTSYYNFDEFYKEHYGRNIRESYHRKMQEKEAKKEFEQWSGSNRRIIALYGLSLPIILIAILSILK